MAKEPLRLPDAIQLEPRPSAGGWTLHPWHMSWEQVRQHLPEPKPNACCGTLRYGVYLYLTADFCSEAALALDPVRWAADGLTPLCFQQRYVRDGVVTLQLRVKQGETPKEDVWVTMAFEEATGRVTGTVDVLKCF